MFNINFNLIVVDNCFVFVGLLRTGAKNGFETEQLNDKFIL